MKNKWFVPVVLFAVLLLCYIIRGFFQTRITVEMLQTDKIEESSSGLGVLIKSEDVNSFSVGGATEILVRNGQRVANRQLIATVYSGTEDENVKIQLADVNKKINAIKDSNSGEAVFINDAAKIESEISDNVDEIIEKISVRDLESISEYKYHISTLADQKAVAKGEKKDFSNDLTQLMAEKSVLESKLGKIESVVTASRSGVFVEGSDGFEESLSPNTIEDLNPKTVNDIINREKNGEIISNEAGSYTYKIVDNYSYYIAMNIDDSMSSQVNVGDSVKLRFLDFDTSDCSAVIKFISEKNEKNMRTVVAECNTYIDGLLSKRVVSVDFIRKSVTGYKVKVEYLHTEDNAVGLFIKRGAVMKFIPVNIVYSTDEEAIVSAASNEKPIKSYDEVVISAPKYYDGMVIVSQ